MEWRGSSDECRKRVSGLDVAWIIGIMEYWNTERTACVKAQRAPSKEINLCVLGILAGCLFRASNLIRLFVSDLDIRISDFV
jgi:hypothetical protein